MESYIAIYRNGKLDKEDLDVLGDNLGVLQFDINTGNLNPFFTRVFQSVFGPARDKQSYRFLKFFDCDQILEAIQKLTDKEADVITSRLGLYDDELPTLKELSKSLDTPSKENVRAIQNRALRKLRHRSNLKYFSPVYDDSSIDEQKLTDEEKATRSAILDRIYGSNLIFVPDENFSHEPNNIDTSELIYMASELCSIKRNLSERTTIPQSTPELNSSTSSSIYNDEAGMYVSSNSGDSRTIEELNLSVRATNALKGAGINTVAQLVDTPPYDLISIRNIGKLTFNEIQDVLSLLKYSPTISSSSDISSQYSTSVPSATEGSEPFNFKNVETSDSIADLNQLKLLKALKSIYAKKLKEQSFSAKEKSASCDYAENSKDM